VPPRSSAPPLTSSTALKSALYHTNSRRSLPFMPAAAAASFPPQRALLRNFIASSLYDKAHGYFCKGDTGRKIGRIRTPLPFAAMKGREEFRARAAKLYDDLESSWLTPSELFSPFYGAAGSMLPRPYSSFFLSLPNQLRSCALGCRQRRWSASRHRGRSWQRHVCS
jgi:hypothetical protein